MGAGIFLKTGTRVHSDVPRYQKPELGYMRMFSGTKNRNEGTFAKTAVLRNRPSVFLKLGNQTGTENRNLFPRNRNGNQNRQNRVSGTETGTGTVPSPLNCRERIEERLPQRNRRSRKMEPLELLHARTLTEPNRGPSWIYLIHTHTHS